jgi:tetratricopeptide (TPR) repeat protein
MRTVTLWIVVAGLAGSAAASGLPAATEDRWIEVRTPTFTFFSNAGLEKTRKVAVDLASFRSVLAGIIRDELDPPEDIRVFVFRDDASFEPYSIRTGARPAAVGGYFLSRPDGGVIAVNAGTEQDPSEIVFHEYVHAVMAKNRPALPVWLSEGIASFYESVQIRGSTAVIGRPIEHHLTALADGFPMPMEEMLRVDRESPVADETARSGAFYAQSWAVAHWLLVGPADRQRQIGLYLDMLGRGSNDPAAFTAAFGCEPDAVEPEVLAHLRRDVAPTERATSPTATLETVSAVEIPRARLLGLLGGLLSSHDPPLPGAAAHLETAVALDPGNARAVTWLGVLAEQSGDLDEARPRYRAAVAADPADPWARYRLGAFLFRRTAERSQAILQLEKSLEIDPTFAPAWGVLAAAYAETGRVDPDIIAAAGTAHRLLPSDLSVSRALLTLILRADQRDRALEFVAATFEDDPIERARGLDRIAANDLARTRDALVLGDLEAAERRLGLARELAAASSDRHLLQLQVDELSETVAEHRAAARLETASELFTDGEPRSALVIVEEILAERPEGSTAAAAAALRRRILEPGAPDQPPPGTRVVPLTSPGEIGVLNRLLAAGDLDGALALLEDLDARVSADDRSWIDVKISEIRRARNHNRFAEAYNSAVDEWNAGRAAAAETILTDLLTTLPDGPDADEARALLARVRAGSSHER